MALWMENGSEPLTEREKADLEAISAIKESASIELKEQGNDFVKKGKKHYSDAIDCYTRAINMKALSDSETCILFSNRAHVNLLMGNYRRALMDAEEAIKLSPTYVKVSIISFPYILLDINFLSQVLSFAYQAYYRAVKAALSLNLLLEAKTYCKNGLTHSPDNEELKKLEKQIDVKLSEHQQRETQISTALTAAKVCYLCCNEELLCIIWGLLGTKINKNTQDLLSAIGDRKLKIGKSAFQELTALKKPRLDKDKVLHWPLLLLYPEFMTSDIIEDFCETDMFSMHLNMMFSDINLPLVWDKENAYTRETIELYYEVGPATCLSQKALLKYFLDGTPAAQLESFGDEYDADTNGGNTIDPGSGGPKWIRVNERRILNDILKEPKLVIPGIPVFYIVSKKSSFYKDFKAGKWSLPG
ncbi:tetratricopeptide repeat protein 4 homolog [Impatiens glandulifera]|uniref:tetratricopeptide repeat protein 4 homolog n=1 Tax=Impatiens glandulifera TaxID=253017 RepID=UPI001FB17F17|nr:tetratricopeptide repeat protein 4 homolog [Impatiens glandulifera]